MRLFHNITHFHQNSVSLIFLSMLSDPRRFQCISGGNRSVRNSIQNMRSALIINCFFKSRRDLSNWKQLPENGVNFQNSDARCGNALIRQYFKLDLDLDLDMNLTALCEQTFRSSASYTVSMSDFAFVFS